MSRLDSALMRTARRQRPALTMPSPERVLDAVRAFVAHPRTVNLGGQGGVAANPITLPGGSVVDICRALDCYEQLVSPTLKRLQAEGRITVQKVGPYRCHVLTERGTG